MKPTRSTKLSLQERLDKFQNFPSIPQVLEHVREVSENPKASPADLAAVIMADHQLTSRILRMANSAFYRESSGKVTTVTQAIILLGTRAVTNLAASATLFEAMNQFSRKSSFDIVGFWTRSLATGVMARTLAMRLNRSRLAEEAFMAGFMHDIGQVILAGTFPLQYEKISELERDSNKIHQTEMILLGIDHQDAGEYLTLKWRLPEGLSRVVGHHHDIETLPREKTDTTLTALVHIADLLYPILLGDANEVRLETVLRAGRTYVAVTPDMIRDVLTSAPTEIHEIAGDFGIDISEEFKKQSRRLHDPSQLLKLLERTESRLLALESAIEGLSSAESIDSLVAIVSESIYAGLHHSPVAVITYDETLDRYTPVTSCGFETPEAVGELCSLIDPGAQALLQEGRTVARHNQTAYVNDDSLRSPLKTMSTLVLVPLEGVKRTFGVAIICEGGPNPVDNATVRWIETLVQTACLALERVEKSGDTTQPTTPAVAQPVIS
ncbi:MAG: HDOD domain-containing protein [Candidatus Zixiibacteriota bacterium]